MVMLTDNGNEEASVSTLFFFKIQNPNTSLLHIIIIIPTLTQTHHKLNPLSKQRDKTINYKGEYCENS